MAECLDDLNSALPYCEVEGAHENSTKTKEENKSNKKGKVPKPKPKGTTKGGKEGDGYQPQKAE